jgi:YVTN family beta-propeller protein
MNLIFKIMLTMIMVVATYSMTGCKPKPATRDKDVYAHTQADMMQPAAKTALHRVYVPNSLSNTVSVIDPATYQVIQTFPAGKIPQHVVPAHDLNTLWVLNNKSNDAIPINPQTGKPGAAIKVDDPYNLYYTPDGRFAIVVAEARRQLNYSDPQTFKLVDSIPVKCRGVNHMEFTIDGRYALATCEFAGQLVKIDVQERKVLGYLALGADQPGKGSMPQDIRSSPDGRVFYVADLTRGGVFLIDPVEFKQIGFVPSGVGTHSLYPSRDGRFMYIGNRGCPGMGCNLPNYCPPRGRGSVSVLDLKTEKIVANWPVPGGGSPDMGNVSADGKELWLSGRYDAEVYVFDTTTGQLTHRIPVGKGPHGLAIWPQPGRYSLGHTGNMR